MSNDAEAILGTDPNNPDTDGDGVSDGAEVQQGTDPLSGFAVQTGVLATVDTPGNAVDVAALNNIVAVADGDAGVALFNVASVLNPVRLAQIGTAGYARAVSLTATKVAVATSSGLALIEVSDPGNAALIGQFNFGSAANAVATAGSLAYVGLANGQIVVFDMDALTEVERHIYTGGPINDLSISGGFLYAITVTGISPQTVHRISLAGPLKVPDDTLTLAFGPTFGRVSIAAGGEYVYIGAIDDNFANQAPGVTILRSSASGLELIGQSSAITAFEIAPTGSGLLLFTGADPGLTGTAKIGVLDVRDPSITNRFITSFDTPGVAQAVSIYNGLGFVADGPAGLSVVNYLAYDALGIPPAITIATSFGGALAEEGKIVGVFASVTDDVQVRNVEFYVDGARAVTDGNFPFEHSFLTPLITPTKNTFTLRAKATDTGGNSTWSDELTITLVPDATPPRVARFIPPPGSFTGSIHSVAATFTEPIDVATLNAATFALTGAGPDGVFGTADDVAPTGGVLSYHDTTNTAFLNFPQDLPPSLYRLTVRAPLADLAGNVIAASVQTQFRVFGFLDSDGDGVPDDIETSIGLDPNNPDTNGNGVRDGNEDFDHDGLPNAFEIAYGYDPTRTDTNGNCITDDNEDPDFDGLTNAQEAASSTDPFNADSDGDGFDDATEVAQGTSPVSPNDVTIVIASESVSYLNGLTEIGLPGALVTINSAPVSYLNALTELALPGAQITLHSAPVSYLNAQDAGFDTGTVLQISTGIVTYRNNPTAPAAAFTPTAASIQKP